MLVVGGGGGIGGGGVGGGVGGGGGGRKEGIAATVAVGLAVGLAVAATVVVAVVVNVFNTDNINLTLCFTHLLMNPQLHTVCTKCLIKRISFSVNFSSSVFSRNT